MNLAADELSYMPTCFVALCDGVTLVLNTQDSRLLADDAILLATLQSTWSQSRPDRKADLITRLT